MKIDREPLWSDIVLDLVNRRYTVFDIRFTLQNMRPDQEFGFIIPRPMLDAVPLPYDLQEMDYDAMLSQPDTAQAVIEYQHWDAVMIKRRWQISS